MFSYILEIYLQCHFFLQNGTSRICYKKMRPTIFHTFLNLVGVCEDFPTELYAHPPYLHSFSDFTFEEMVGAKELVHWEASLEGKLVLRSLR